jgi:aspartyl protease family protein
MSASFDARQGLVVVAVQATGPSGIAVLRLALDTGATRTLINAGLLVAVGYDPAASRDRTEVTTGSGVEFAAVVRVSRIVALGRELTDFPVLAHTLPPSAGVDGVLGLDFFRGQVLTIDLQRGGLTLAEQGSLSEPSRRRSRTRTRRQRPGDRP